MFFSHIALKTAVDNTKSYSHSFFHHLKSIFGERSGESLFEMVIVTCVCPLPLYFLRVQ